MNLSDALLEDLKKSPPAEAVVCTSCEKKVKLNDDGKCPECGKKQSVSEGRSSDITYHVVTTYKDSSGATKTSKDSWQAKWGTPSKASLAKIVSKFSDGTVISAKVVRANGDTVASYGSANEAKETCAKCGKAVKLDADGKCPECGAKSVSEAKSECSKCGETVKLDDDGKCPECGAKSVSEGSAFCKTCDEKVKLDDDGKCPECGSKVVSEEDDLVIETSQDQWEAGAKLISDGADGNLTKMISERLARVDSEFKGAAKRMVRMKQIGVGMTESPALLLPVIRELRSLAKFISGAADHAVKVTGLHEHELDIDHEAMIEDFRTLYGDMMADELRSFLDEGATAGARSKGTGFGRSETNAAGEFWTKGPEKGDKKAFNKAQRSGKKKHIDAQLKGEGMSGELEHALAEDDVDVEGECAVVLGLDLDEGAASPVGTKRQRADGRTWTKTGAGWVPDGGKDPLHHAREAKKTMDMLLKDAPEGHKFKKSALPKHLHKYASSYQALGAEFEGKVLHKDHDDPDSFIVGKNRHKGS